MNVWLFVLLSMHQAADLKLIDPNFKTDPGWQEVKTENAADVAAAQGEASTAPASRTPNPEIPQEVLQGFQPRRVPELQVDGSSYGFSPTGLHKYCADNPAACADDPLRHVVRDVDTSLGVAIASSLVGLASAITVRVATAACLSSSGCSNTMVGLDIGAAATTLIGLGVSFYLVHRIHNDLEIWRETTRGNVENEVAELSVR